jgi:hydroxyacylglutathione hydrolase
MFMRMVYDEKLAQAAYLIGCQKTGEAIIIDPQRDVDRYIKLAENNDLRIIATAETHIHADFLSGSRELAEQVNAKVFVSDEGDADWKYQWLDKKAGGVHYSHQLLKDGDTFSIGNIDFKVIHTPGHTPEHIAFLVTDTGGGANEPIGIATGDFVFVGDLGRPDLLETAAGKPGAMEPSAKRLYKTLDTLKDLPDFVQIWPAHGAGSACGKALGAVPTSTVGYERRFNTTIKAATSEQAFVDFILSGQPEPPLYFATMKRVNKEGPAVLNGLPIPPRLNAEELQSIDSSSTAIIDTRDWEDFRRNHIAGAISIPLINAFNTYAGSFIAETEPIALIIDPSHVEEAVRDLIRVGLDNIVGWFDPADLPNCSVPFASTDQFSVDQAASAIESDPNLQVLDVRRAVEFDAGHLPDAINFAHTRIASNLDKLPKDKRLLVQCLSGCRSARTASYLQRMGFDVVNLDGGFTAWQATQAVHQ